MPLPAEGDGELPLDRHEVERDAFIPGDDSAVRALIAWRTYNEGARLEQRIEELGELAIGRTAVDDVGATSFSGPSVPWLASSCTSCGRSR